MVASLYPKEVSGRRFQKGDLADWTNTASFLFVETEGMRKEESTLTGWAPADTWEKQGVEPIWLRYP